MIAGLLHRKEMLVFTAIDVLNEYGIQALSTKEIARRQGISEATIFKHFKTKNELIIGILDHYSQYDSDIMAASIQLSDPIESISFFIKAYAEYYQNYPAITAITQAYDILSGDQDLEKKITYIYKSRRDFIMELLKKAKENGRLIPNTDPEKLTDIISGVCNGICLKWRLSGYEFSLKEYTLSTVKMLLDAFII